MTQTNAIAPFLYALMRPFRAASKTEPLGQALRPARHATRAEFRSLCEQDLRMWINTGPAFLAGAAEGKK